MAPIQDVKNIVAGSLASPKNGDLKYSCACDIYAYVVKNIKYDNAKISNLTPDYLPDIEETYADKAGICYDYSSLFAAMLRSIGIPAKLVKGYAGYAPDSYHAWNEVYIDNQWSVIDTTRDATLLANGEKFDIIKKASDYSIVHEY
jgi:transglutaminase-like putative cysteine protease